MNVWFLVALSLPLGYESAHISTTAWSQALAWLIGSAYWIAFMLIEWLAQQRRSMVSHFPEIPGDTSPVTLTPPRIFFAVLRAVAIAGAVAVAFGFDLPEADWMPIAAIVAMKPGLDQSVLVAEQRLAGAIIGAAAAALFLLTIDTKDALHVVVIVFATIAQHPRRELCALLRRDRLFRPRGDGPTASIRLGRRGQARAVHLHRRGHRRRRHADRERASEAARASHTCNHVVLRHPAPLAQGSLRHAGAGGSPVAGVVS